MFGIHEDGRKSRAPKLDNEQVRVSRIMLITSTTISI